MMRGEKDRVEETDRVDLGGAPSSAFVLSQTGEMIDLREERKEKRGVI
jgi:hypothetical protein